MTDDASPHDRAIRGSLSITAILATNVFERRAARWLLVHHHASHILAPQDPGPEAP